jgi:hypothetical protein
MTIEHPGGLFVLIIGSMLLSICFGETVNANGEVELANWACIHPFHPYGVELLVDTKSKQLNDN